MNDACVGGLKSIPSLSAAYLFGNSRHVNYWPTQQPAANAPSRDPYGEPVWFPLSTRLPARLPARLLASSLAARND
jgi:hypothetical protein